MWSPLEADIEPSGAAQIAGLHSFSEFTALHPERSPTYIQASAQDHLVDREGRLS